MKSLAASAEAAAELKTELQGMQSIDLTQQQECDLELLINGSFSPLEGFLEPTDYERVVEEMRLADGTLWPIPITLDVSDDLAAKVNEGERVALRDGEGVPLAVMTVKSKWRPDRKREAQKVFGTRDFFHPGVRRLMRGTRSNCLGGPVAGLETRLHDSFTQLRHSPAELRALFKKWGWERVVAFQTRNPMHRAHYELTMRAAREFQANLLIHPVVGTARDGDVDYYTRVRCYLAILRRYPQQTVALSLLPLAMRMGGPREALWHAIIRKNYGCTHFIVGRDHAGPGKDSDGKPFYLPLDAQELALAHQEELGIEIAPFENMVYVKSHVQYMPESKTRKIAKADHVGNISGTELRRRLELGLPIPGWFSFPEVIAELRRGYPPRSKRGFTVFFTGLSGAGKSTVAKVLAAKFEEIGDRPVTLLDGDIVRKNLSNELGFSKEHRDINIRRIGFVAGLVTKNRGIAICAPIAPYEAARKDVRRIVTEQGGFVLVHVATPLEVCEQRDRKGLYAKARAGLIQEFTGISDTYEAPTDAEITLDTTQLTPEEAAQRVLLYLEGQGYVS